MPFNRNDFIEFVIKETFRRDYLLKVWLNDKKEENIRDQTVINVKFKTTDNGVVLYIIGQTGYLTFMVGINKIHRYLLIIMDVCVNFLSFFCVTQVKNTKLAYVSEHTLSGHVSEFTVDSPVADGLWHVVLLVSNGQGTLVLLDGEPVLNLTEQSMDLTPVTVEKVILGAAMTSDSNIQHPGEFSQIMVGHR